MGPSDSDMAKRVRDRLHSIIVNLCTGEPIEELEDQMVGEQQRNDSRPEGIYFARKYMSKKGKCS